MKRKIFFGWIISLSVICSASAQQADQKQKRRFVVVPAEQALVTIAFQPDCPLQFEEAELLAAIDGRGGTAGYAIRNKGAKPIRSFTIDVPGATVTWSEELTKRLFMPGERTPDDDIEIVPLTDELRNKLKLTGPMKTVAVFMVIRIEYADGTVYSAESTYKAFLKFSDEMIELRANSKPR
jgi:hypothetical protein